MVHVRDCKGELVREGGAARARGPHDHDTLHLDYGIYALFAFWGHGVGVYIFACLSHGFGIYLFTVYLWFICGLVMFCYGLLML